MLLKPTFRATCVAAALLTLGASFPGLAAEPQTLSDLIRDNQRDAVLAAITSPDLDVNTPDADGSTPLMWAVYKVDPELVRALLKRGAKARVVNQYGDSPLTEAVKVGDVGIAKELLAAGADVESANGDGQTALMLASSIGSLPIAQMLVDKGAKVNTVEKFRGQTALMWAAAENHPDIVELLLRHGAAKQINLRARYDDWPRQLTSEPRAQFRQTGGLTALLYATRSACLRCAQALVKAGADINQPNPDGITPLINALDSRAFDVAMFLLDKGANPGAWDMTGRTPLYVAVDMHSLTARGFLGFGGQVGPPPQGTATAMDVINRLLALGLDPNHQLTRMRPNGPGRGRFGEYMLRGGTGALLVATLGFDEEVIKALLAHGAEVDLRNVFQITPLMAAAGMDSSGRGGGPGPGLGEGDVQAKAIRSIDLLLAGGADINARITGSRTHTGKIFSTTPRPDNEGKTALFAAASVGWDRVVKELLARGADVTVKDADGKTALDYARRTPPMPGGGPPPPAVAAARAATVALLEAAAGGAATAPAAR